MSEDISPTWIVLLESTYRIIQVFFCIFPMSQDSIMIRFVPMSVLDHFKFPKWGKLYATVLKLYFS